MAHPHPDASKFIPLNIAVLTVSDTRTESTDSSGRSLCDGIKTADHVLIDKQILSDDKYLLRALISTWIANAQIQVILITGGTGMAERDITPEAILPLFDKTIDGFGELFRQISFNEIGTSTVQSRALAGIANGTFIFCLPGSTNACQTAWNKILKNQFDIRSKPCNFAQLMSLDVADE